MLSIVFKPIAFKAAKLHLAAAGQPETEEQQLCRQLYPQHLHPRHGGDEALRRRHHRQRHQPDHVAHKNSRRGTDDAIRPSSVLS